MTVQVKDQIAWRRLVDRCSVGQRPGSYIVISAEDRREALELIDDDCLYDALDGQDITTVIDQVSLRQMGRFGSDFQIGAETVAKFVHQLLHDFAAGALRDAIAAEFDQRIDYYDNGRHFGLTGCEL